MRPTGMPIPLILSIPMKVTRRRMTSVKIASYFRFHYALSYELRLCGVWHFQSRLEGQIPASKTQNQNKKGEDTTEETTTRFNAAKRSIMFLTRALRYMTEKAYPAQWPMHTGRHLNRELPSYDRFWKRRKFRLLTAHHYGRSRNCFRLSIRAYYRLAAIA